jgi:hypothetical protein
MRKTTVTVLDSQDQVVMTDQADLQSDEERRKLAGRIARRMHRDASRVREQLEAQWNATSTRHRRLRQQAEAGSPEAASADDMPAGGLTAATRLIEMVRQAGAELSHTADGTPYASVDDGGRRQTWPLRSRAFRAWARLVYYRSEGRSLGTQSVEDALGVLEGIALCDGQERPVDVRLAGHGQDIYLDLADTERRVVKVTRHGWSITNDPPVLFRRPRGVLSLPLPKQGGDLMTLRRLVNVREEADWQLLVVWLLAALRPRGPYPVLCMHGQQGCAKSTMARMLRSLVDPSAACLRSAPRDGRDVMIAATNGWVVALDNLSAIEPWLSDCLCRLATGGGYATRELFTDVEEIILDAQRPVILTSIEDLATRGDLLDRGIVQTLPPIPEQHRRLDAELWEEYERVRPLLLGALLDALVGSLAELPGVRLVQLPRMADFALLGAAAERHLKWPAGSFASAYKANRQGAHGIALDASSIVPPLLQLVEAGEWTGTAGELLRELAGRAPETVTRGRDWPARPQSLSGRLRRLAPNLLAIGVSVSFAARTVHGVPITVRRVNPINEANEAAPSTCSVDDDYDVPSPWDDERPR